MSSDPSEQKFPDYFVSFCSEITPSSAEHFLNFCCRAPSFGVERLHILFSTQGGNILQGIHIYHVLRALPFDVIMYNTGTVASVGNVVFLAGDKRFACPGATFMFHGVAMPSQSTNVDARIVQAFSDEIHSGQRKMAGIINDRAKFKSEADIMSLFEAQESRGSDFALEHGIISAVENVTVPHGTPIEQFVYPR